MRNQFNYINTNQGFTIHNSLVNNRLFSPLQTPKPKNKNLIGESVFKTPNSGNFEMIDQKDNELGSDHSRHIKKRVFEGQ
jgi:hypothetical protein